MKNAYELFLRFVVARMLAKMLNVKLKMGFIKDV